MNKEFITWAIVPARSGSKGIKHKNIIPFLKKPLMAHSINFAKKLKFIDRVILSTDSEKYKKIGKKFGAEVPFLRSKKAHFDETALDVNYEFPLWVQYIRCTENLLGNRIKKIYKSEHHKYLFRKKAQKQ